MSRYSTRLPRNYAQAEQMLGNRERRTVLNNTVLERGGRRRINVLHHGNLIGAFDPNGSIMLTNSGYGSVSTRERLNGMTPAGVGFVQRDYSQRVQVNNGRQIIDEPTGTLWIDRDGYVTV